MSSPVSLLCLPCAGSSATMYLRWRRLLPPWIDVLPVELPGRGSRLAETLVEDFETLVDELCAEQAAAMRGHYVLFGHSMGALLVYGMVQRQRTLGRALPRALVVSGSPAPSRRDPDRFANKDDDETLIADLRKQGGTAEEVFASPELLRITLDVLGADYRVCESFRYRDSPALPLPVHAFAGRHDDIAPERIATWADETCVASTFDWFEGGHFFIRHRERQVLTTLAERLDKSVARGLDASRALASAPTRTIRASGDPA